MPAYAKNLAITLLMLLSAMLAAPSASHAQQASAAVNGVVYDASNAAVVDAQVKLINVDTRVARTSTTNRSGTYVFLDVTPGSYTVQIERRALRA